MKTKRKILSTHNRFTKKKHISNKLQYRAAIIPHAGSKYAGQARETVFSKMREQHIQRPIKKIIYISAIHNSANINPGVYEFSKDDGFGKTPSLEKLPNTTEHSFKWVENELRKSFPLARILVVTPVKIYKNLSLQKWITEYMKKHQNCLLFSTTDLTHHGKNYNNNSLQHPHRLGKQDLEEEFIGELVRENLSPPKIMSFVKRPGLLCGPFAIAIFVNIMRALGMTGKVTDYYDSNFGEKKLNKYVISNKPAPDFVSYVSIIYGKGVSQHKLEILDIMMAIGVVKSEIIKVLHNNHYTIRLPYWSPFYKMKQGVFVGTSIGNKTNCSYGRYEVDSKSAKHYNLSESTADKMVGAAGDCIKDARDRWKIPYNINELDKLNYKIELLQPKRKWLEYPGKEVKQHFKMDGKQGIYLMLKDRKDTFTKRAATYLPVVARENRQWSIEEYMNSLSKKAGGLPQEWKDGKIKIYTSTSYTWNSSLQKLIIE